MKSKPVRPGSQSYLVDRFYREQDNECFALLADLSGLGWSPMSADVEVLLQMHGICRRCGQAVDLFADHAACAPGVDWWGDRVVIWVPEPFAADVEREVDPVGRQRRLEYTRAKSREGNQRRAEQIEAGGQRHTKEEIRALYELQEGHCFYCFTSLRIDNSEWDAARDHFVPLARGGHDGISNIVLTCRLCNNRKLAKEGHRFLKLAKLAATEEMRAQLTLLHRRHRKAYPEIWDVTKRPKKRRTPIRSA